MKFIPKFFLSLILVSGVFCEALAQDAPEEDVFRLVQAEQAQQIYERGITCRRVKGNARFLHNDTYLVCDSASWNVDGNYIEAFGNVQIIQEGTMLRSQEMIYLIDQNLAKFRGGVVELLDKDGNTLRTTQLDYNTKDSVGIFRYGGAVRDTSGGIIESQQGTYDSKISTFTFEKKVELKMDSIELKTTTLRYLTNYSKAYFGQYTEMWRGNGLLCSNAGSYDRNTTVAEFSDNVYMNDPQYEAWSDHLVYDQVSGRVDMFRNSQILDTTHKSSYLAHRIVYEPSGTDSADLWKDRIILTVEPAIVYRGENENHQPDTLYMTGDSIKVLTLQHCDIDPQEFEDGAKRIEDMEFDAIAKTREEQAKARAEENEKKMQSAGKAPPAQLWGAPKDSSALAASDSTLLAVSDTTSLEVPSGNLADSIPIKMPELVGHDGDVDSTSLEATSGNLADSISVRDTTPIRYIYAYRNARAYRSDVQVACDSMVFSEVDSIARLYGRPVLWNEIKNQLTAETMQLLIKNGNLYRGSMITDAWVISQVDSTHFHQIKSTEMLGYFYNNELYRYDGLGGVNAVFYLVEDAKVTTVNIKESKSMTALIKDGDAKRILYLESIQSDAYPIGDLVPERQRLKGFEWRGEERPVDRNAITTRELKDSDRDKYKHLRRPLFPEYHKYFDEKEPETPTEDPQPQSREQSYELSPAEPSRDRLQ